MKLPERQGSSWRAFTVLSLLVVSGSGRAQTLPTQQRPLIVDKEAKRVLVYTEVNELYLYQPSVHWGIVFKDGKFGDRAILKSYAKPVEVHDALVAIGARPGNNLKEGEATGKSVEGDELELSATWPGLNKEIPLREFISDSAGKGFRIRFGGNRGAAEEKHTGCITCLESCWISIASNAQYPVSKPPDCYARPHSTYKGRPEVLPAKDHAAVVIVFRVKKTAAAGQ